MPYPDHYEEKKGEERTIHIEHDNYMWLSTYADSNETLLEISNYLKENDLKIEIHEINTHGAKFEIHEVYLEGVKLSKGHGMNNGFNKRVLIDHVRYYRKAKAKSETDEYKQFVELLDKYKATYIYLKTGILDDVFIRQHEETLL